jgi:hypothetical protein
VQANDDPGFTTFYADTLPGTATNWTPSGPLVPGPNSLFVAYRTNNYPGISISVPTNGSGSSLTGWTAQSSVQSYAYSSFNVASMGGGGHTLRAHYTFEDGLIFAADESGNGNDISSLGSTGGGTRHTTNTPAIGDFSAFFNNNNGTGGGWLIPPTNLLSTLAASFTVSLWVQTTQVSGNDNDSGLFNNAGLVAAFSGPGNWVVPMALTGSKLGFATGGSFQHTLRSSTSITNNSLVHVAVTRNLVTGEKKIYINGELDAFGIGSTTLLDSPTSLRIGYNNGTGLQGVMDDIQIYSGVLSASEIAFLFNNPGSTVPNVGGSELGEAVDAPELPWTTGGDTDWFLQTDETGDGMDAAQSGSIDHDQSSWIETTVEGPGTFSFWWKVSSDDIDSYDYLEFTVNDDYESDIYGEWDWEYYEIYLDPGTHTLRWTYWKDSDFTSGSDAGWLDEVEFTPEIEVDLTLRIERSFSPLGESYLCLPILNYVSPSPVTTHEVESPSGLFSATLLESSSASLNSLQEVIDELEAEPWTIFVNRGHPSERQYTFNVTVTGLTTNDLPPVTIVSPALWATVPPNTGFSWTGPAGYSSLFVHSYLAAGGASGGFTNPPVASTMWTPPNPLAEGTNEVLVSYTLDSIGDVVLSDPLDSSFNYLSSWSYSADLAVRATSHFIVGDAAPPNPVQILNPRVSGTNFSLSLMTENGRTHSVEAATNLTTAPWLEITNFSGDGNLFQLLIPIGNRPETYYRVGSQ